MGLRKNGNAAIRQLRGALRGMPLTLAREVTIKAAPAMTTLTRNAFSAGQTVHGEARPEAVGGGSLSLVKTGTVAGELKFVAVDKVIRCVIGPNYARFLIGKYEILPNGWLPSSWVRRLEGVVSEVKVQL